jgi:hypothetical protein
MEQEREKLQPYSAWKMLLGNNIFLLSVYARMRKKSQPGIFLYHQGIEWSKILRVKPFIHWGDFCHSSSLSFEFFFFSLFTYSHVHTLFGSFLLPDHCSLPTPSHPTSPGFQAEPILPLTLILLKRRHKHNKKDKAFLLVEIRIAIQRDS